MTHDHFRLDWRQEAKKLKPYFDGKPGVVRINFKSKEAAVDKFNHFIKEQFQNGNGKWLSLRIDDDWSTTFTTNDQIYAVARKLEEAGVAVDLTQPQSAVGDVASGNQANGNININVCNALIMNGIDYSPEGVQARLELVCDAMREFVENGGHFMLVVNDMKCHDQGKFWKTIWNAGLQDAGGDKILLVYYVGLKCGSEPHDDAPKPHLSFRLPDDIETDETRLDDVYDDIIEILTTNKGYSREEASATAKAIIPNNSQSVRKLHIALSKTIIFNDAKKGCV